MNDVSGSAAQSPESSGSMSRSVAKSAAWTTGANAARIASGILVIPVLARFLQPSDFGIMQIAMPVVLFLMMFGDLGFGPALVRAKQVSNAAWSSVFWVTLAIGALLSILLYLASAPVASWFRHPEATPILQVLSCMLVLGCFNVTPAALLQRRLRFDQLAMLEVFSVGLGIAAALFGAIRGAGAWALVWQQLTMFIIKTVGLWALGRPPIRFAIDIGALEDLFGFSMNLLASRIVNFFSRNVDNVLIGRMLGAASLGYYSIAYRILLMPVEIFAWGLSQILIPTIGKFQDNKPRVQAACLRTYRLISAMTFPAMTGIAVLAYPIVSVLLGERMMPAAPVLQILAPIGALQSVSTTQGSINVALGRADIVFGWSLLSLIVVTIGFAVGVNFGLMETALSYLVATLILAPPYYARVMRLIDLTLVDFLKALSQPFSGSLIMAAVLIAANSVLPAGTPDFVRLVTLIPLGVATYGASMFLLNRQLVFELIGIAKDIISR